MRRLNLDVGRFRSRRTLDGFLSWALAEYRINMIVDVGANEGQFARRTRRLGYQGRICSFEPVPSTFARLTRNCGGDSRWNGYNLALGRETGRVNLWFSEAHSDMASLHRIGQAVPARFAAWSRSPVQQMTVPVRKLDDIETARLDDDSARIFIKCDTQGHDVDVLMGARRVLQRTDLIMLEAAVVKLYAGMPDIVESLEALRHIGFQPAAFFPVTSVRRNSIPVIEFDVLACRRDRDTSPDLMQRLSRPLRMPGIRRTRRNRP